MSHSNRLLAKHARELKSNNTYHPLQQGITRYVILFLCIGVDTVTLFSLFDALLAEIPVMTVITTATTAAFLNISPMFVAATMQNPRYTTLFKVLLGTLLGVMFIALYALTCVLRWETIDLMYAGNVTLEPTYSLAETAPIVSQAVETELTDGQKWLAVIMAALPLCTSGISFFLGCDSNAMKKQNEYYLLERQEDELQEELIRLDAQIQELKDEQTYDLEGADEENYNNGLTEIDHLMESAVDYSHVLLAEKIGTPEGISYVIERRNIKTPVHV